jgi:hypothetical protein
MVGGRPCRQPEVLEGALDDLRLENGCNDLQFAATVRTESMSISNTRLSSESGAAAGHGRYVVLFLQQALLPDR